MDFQTYDASGAPVGPDTIFCSCCGQRIVNVTYFKNMPYGPECIKTVTGEPKDSWIIKNGHIDEAATAAHKAQVLKSAEDMDKADKAARAARQEWRVARRWLVDMLSVEVVRSTWFPYMPDDPSRLAKKLDEANTILYYKNHDTFEGRGWIAFLVAQLYNNKQVSPWLADKVSDTIARCSGRRNSKAYTKAYDEVSSRIENELPH